MTFEASGYETQEKAMDLAATMLSTADESVCTELAEKVCLLKTIHEHFLLFPCMQVLYTNTWGKNVYLSRHLFFNLNSFRKKPLTALQSELPHDMLCYVRPRDVLCSWLLLNTIIFNVLWQSIETLINKGITNARNSKKAQALIYILLSKGGARTAASVMPSLITGFTGKCVFICLCVRVSTQHVNCFSVYSRKCACVCVCANMF